MKFIAKNKGYESLSEEELLETLLRQRGVKDVEKFLSISEKDVLDGMLLKNMGRGLELLHGHIKNNSKILVIVDSDLDGYSSGAVIYQYIKDIFKKAQIDFIMHEGKTHGIIMSEIENKEFDLLIVPDAGSSDMEQCKLLKDKGKDILILDHHIIEPTYFNEDGEVTTDKDKAKVEDYASNYAVVINCQDGQYPNANLSGVGVVYKFCKEYDKKYGYDYADKYIDLVAMGMVADDMELKSLETRYLVLKGLDYNFSDKGNQFIKEICTKNERNFDGAPTIINVGWHIAPQLNAVTRTGSMEEKINTFRAMIGEQETIEYQPRRKKGEKDKPPVEYHSLQKTMARVTGNVKGRQDSRVKKGMELLNTKITEQELDKNKIIVVDGTCEIDGSYTGLVANKIAGIYKRPAIILREKDKNNYGGSGRNYSLFAIDNLNKFLQELGCFNSVSGHENAFGFELPINKIEDFIALSNKALKDVVIDDTYHVDYSIPIGTLREKDITQVGRWERLWGNDIEEPLFAITGISVKPEDVILNEKKNYLKIIKQIGARTFTFYKFSNEEEYFNIIGKNATGFNSKKNSKRLELEIIGKFEISKFNGRPQIKIIDYNIKEAKRFSF